MFTLSRSIFDDFLKSSISFSPIVNLLLWSILNLTSFLIIVPLRFLGYFDTKSISFWDDLDEIEFEKDDCDVIDDSTSAAPLD